MDHLLVESTVRATVMAGGVALVLWAARIRTPAVLHGVWTSVTIAMLLLPLCAVWGPDAPVPVLLPRAVSTGVVVTGPPAASASLRTVETERIRPQPDTAIAARSDAWQWREVAFLIYGLIAGALLMRLAFGTLRAHRLVRLSVLNAGRRTSAACASPVTVGWLRPVVILPDTWREWSDEKLDAVLVHEQEHARRRHPLVQWLALLNRALFWFHPVSWWLARHLTALAEETCDDAVMARGHDPRDYSEYLIETAHAVGRSRRLHLAGVFMPGTCLPQRIRRMLTEPERPRASRARVACAVAGCAIASALSLVATPVRAASQQSVDAARMIVRPLQPRWVPPESTAPQPVSLDWLEGDEWAFEVQSIITNDELTAYSRLRNAQERDAFIARFWARRDPSPGAHENEFRAEYIRRVQVGRERFSSTDQAGFGFDTDRGRMYLMFGAPGGIEVEGTGPERIETWQYSAVPGVGDLRLRFALDHACGLRVVSPAPARTAGAARIYPLGLTTIAIPVDAARTIGVGYELRSANGLQLDNGQIGSVEAAGDALAQHLPQRWFAGGFGCTHALPADTYTLATAVRLATGEVQRDTITFEVE